MVFIGEKSTGWSGPRDDSIQELQETPLRLELIAKLTMNSSLTTTVCPWEISINCVSMEHYQSAIEERTEGEKVKGRKRLRRDKDRLWGSGERMHSFIFKAKTVKYKYSIEVCNTLSSSLRALQILQAQTTHTNNSSQSGIKRRNLFSLFSKKKMKPNLYSCGTKEN